MASRYEILTRLKDSNSRLYLANPIYPTIPETVDDFYIISTQGDRYDLLSDRFYGNREYWWIIASANNSVKDGVNIPPGVQIRIPANLRFILERYENLNNNR